MTENLRNAADAAALANIGGDESLRGDSGIPHVLAGESPHYTWLARVTDWIDRVLVRTASALRVYQDSTDGDLECSVYPGRFMAAETAVSYAGSVNNTLTNNATNYLYLNAAGTLVINTTGFPTPSATPHVPLAAVATGSASAEGTSGLYDPAEDIADYRDRSLFATCGQTAVRARCVPLTDFRKSAAGKDSLPDAADATELGLADAQGSLILGTTTNNTSATEKAAVRVAIPAGYVAGQAVTLRVRAKVSVARFVSATVDAVVKECGDTLGADICATAAQNLTVAFVNYDFTITPTDLVAGDELNIELTLATNDTGGSSAGYPAISHVELRSTDLV